MRKRTFAGMAAVALLVTGCSTGGGARTADPAGQPNGAAGVVPAVVQPVQLRDILHSTMKGKRVAFVPILFKGFKITQQWSASMQRTFSMLGAEYKVYDSNFDTDQMVRTLDDLISNKKVDVLVIHNPDLGVLTKQIKDAAAAGIYTVVLNMPSNQSGDVFIGADVVSAGSELATRAIDDCKAAGRPIDLAVLDGPGTDGFSVTFNAGVKKVADAAGAKVLDTQHTNWQADLASQQAATVVQRMGSKLCAILTPWDVTAIPAGQAVSKAVSDGSLKAGDVGVYALDASDDGCNAIRSGLIRAINAYDQPGIGALAAGAVQMLVESGVAPGSQHRATYVSNVMVDKTNLGTFASACYKGQ